MTDLLRTIAFENMRELFSLYGYFILLPIAIIEGPLATVVAGTLASVHLMDLRLAYGLVVLGDMIGDALHYAAGRWGGRFLVLRPGRRLGLSAEQFSSIARHFHAYPIRTLLLGKVQVWNSLVLFAAGASRLPFLFFLGICLLGTVIKSGALILFGYFVGETLETVALKHYLNIAGLLFFALGLVAIRMHFKHRGKTSAPQSPQPPDLGKNSDEPQTAQNL